MFSRRTMQIRPYPQGDTVNGFNHQQNLHRGVCVRECVRLCEGIKHKHASGQLQTNQKITKKKIKQTKALENFETMSVLGPLPPPAAKRLRVGSGKGFFSHADPDFGIENKDGCQTGIVIKIPQQDVTSSTSILYPIITWLKNRGGGGKGMRQGISKDTQISLFWIFACLS